MYFVWRQLLRTSGARDCNHWSHFLLLFGYYVSKFFYVSDYMHGSRVFVNVCVCGWGCGNTLYSRGWGADTKKSRNHFLSSNNRISVDFGSWVIFHILFVDHIYFKSYYLFQNILSGIPLESVNQFGSRAGPLDLKYLQSLSTKTKVTAIG